MQQSFVVLDSKRFISILEQAALKYTKDAIKLNVVEREIIFTDAGPKVEEIDKVVNVAPIPPLDRPRALAILKAMINEYMSQYLMYRTTEPQVDIIASALRDRAVPTANDMALAEHFVTDTSIDSMWVDLITHLSGFMGEAKFGESKWRQWTLVEYGSLLGLISGKDYRIAEWEIHHGEAIEDLHVSIDVRTLLNYIHQTVMGSRGVPESMCAMETISQLVIDYIDRYFNCITFPPTAVTYDHTALTNAGSSLVQFTKQWIEQPVQAFINTYLATRIDKKLAYKGSINNSGILNIVTTELPKSKREKYIDDIRQSLNNGDWVPERDLRRYEEYERQSRY